MLNNFANIYPIFCVKAFGVEISAIENISSCQFLDLKNELFIFT